MIVVPTLLRRAAPSSVFDCCIDPLLETVNTAEPERDAGRAAVVFASAETGVMITVCTSADAFPEFFSARFSEVFVRVADETTIFVLVWSTKAVHQAWPCRLVLVPTLREDDTTALGGSAVAFAEALIMNCGEDEFPELITSVLKSMIASLAAVLLTVASCCIVALIVPAAIAAA